MNDKYSPPLFVKDDTTILTNLKKGEANARYAILAVRDPLGFHDDPADVVGAYMEDVHEISRNPMYTVVSGRYKDAEIIVSDDRVALARKLLHGQRRPRCRDRDSGSYAVQWLRHVHPSWHFRHAAR